MTYRATLHHMTTGMVRVIHRTAPTIAAARLQGYEATQLTSHPYLWRVVVKEER